MNFKKILATLLAVVMVLGTVSVSFAEDTAIFEIEEVEEIVELFEVEEETEKIVAKIGTTGYLSFAEAYEAANDGDTITLLEAVTLTKETTWKKKIALEGATFATAGMLTLADGASLAGENITGTVYTAANATVSVNIPNADLIANGDITFKGDCVVKSFSVKYVGTTIKIGKGATLACAGSGRMVIGHGCKFLIEGNIVNAKTATTEDIKPSLTVAGASFTGNGVTFNVTNAYVRFTAYCSSKDKSANGTHNYNITNSIWDQTGKFEFSAPTSGMDPTFNLTVKDSVFNTTSHIVFAAAKSDVVIDNSIINKDNNQQLENCGNMIIQNGSVVYASDATSSNAKKPGTLTVDNSTYIGNESGEYSGSDLGTGNLILKNDAEVTLGKISNTNITVDTTSCLTTKTIADTCTITIDTKVLNNGKVLDLNESASRKDKVFFTKPVASPAKVVYGDDGDVSIFITVAKIGNTDYSSLAAAISGAKTGDTITILAGTYNGFDIPKESANNLKFVGETDAKGNNLVTIKTLEEGIESHNGGIYVGIETATFKNLNFTAGTAARLQGMASSLGETNSDTGMTSNLKNLTVENCNFTGSGAYQAIWTNTSNLTIKNSTIKNYNKAFYSVAMRADNKIVVDNTEITDVTYGIHLEETTSGSQVAVRESAIDAEDIALGGAVAMNITKSEISNATVSAWSSTVNISESKLIDTSYGAYENSKIVINNNYVNNVNELAANAKADNIAFNTYYPEAKDLGTGNTVAVPAATDAIYVKFENVTDADAEGEMTYNINLVATDTEIINRLNSADLTFAFDATEGDVAYEIIASNSEVAVNPVDNSKVRYEFHYNGKDGVTTDSANKITIGQVRFEGYGKFDFTVDAAVDTNTAHATTVADNIVDTFIPNGDAATVANGELVIDDTTITDVVIAVPDRNLTISIDFPNAVENKAIAYQDMKVVISGGDLDEDITIGLGADAVATELDIFGKADAAYVAAMDNGSYVINVTDALSLNNAYTVTVTGEGYRTARYTVTMTDDKTINFWNNVMDEEHFIEESVDGSKTTKNFLAGDIVKDNNINIYDLSAVVSYFAKVNNGADYAEYVKYDLNRDGVIDSKDVAYVLVSWNE